MRLKLLDAASIYCDFALFYSILVQCSFAALNTPFDAFVDPQVAASCNAYKTSQET